MSFFYTTLAAIFVFGMVILLHELGHFSMAKWAGIQVNEFAVGMGPRLWSRVKGSTRYALRLLPIGGFVMMEGEDGDEPAGEQEDLYPDIPKDAPRGKSFQKVPVGKRMIVIAAGAVMNLILGFALLVILVCMDEAITSKTISGFRLDVMETDGGLQIGDEILAVNGRRCFIANDVVYEIARSRDMAADFTVLRGGEKVELKNVTFAAEQDGAFTIGFTVLPVEKTVWNVTKEAACWTVSFARLVVLSMWDLLTGRVPVNQLSGPVGIIQTLNQAVAVGIRPVLNMMALITVNLGVFNLMPLPALDGGKLVLLAIEKLRGKPLPAKYEGAINMIGFAALMLLMAFVTFNDVSRIFGG